MVQFPSPGKLRPEFVPPSKVEAVKLEIEDPLDEEHGPVNKRSKCAAPFHQWGAGAGMAPSQGIQYNLLDEPSPLGLRLRKSTSFLDLIQMRLSQANSEAGEKEIKSSAANDKLKASNFPVSLLRIGSWECVSKYDGDLVAKCYYAKHKLVWEVLDGGLKSKIEIQWSDIIALKATCPEDGPGTLDIVLGRPPLFFRETNPQPRKHTLWQATSDFTGGQASIDRRHFIQCSPGLLNKHFEKLIQCDPHLNSLSQHPEVILESPYFGTRCSVFEVQDESKCHDSDNPNENNGPCFSGLHNPGSPCAAASSYTKSKVMKPASMELDILPQGTPPSSVVDAPGIAGNANPSRWDRLKVPALRGSMSMIDLANHIGQYCISEQMTSGDPLSDDGLPDKDVLEELAQYLLSDSQAGPTSASDEQSLMSRIDSLCCLLQKPGASNGEGTLRCDAGRDDRPKPAPEASTDDEQPAGMSRIESFGELLMHLPRIASMPQFLFDI